jgi:hypothetical protein
MSTKLRRKDINLLFLTGVTGTRIEDMARRSSHR